MRLNYYNVEIVSKGLKYTMTIGGLFMSAETALEKAVRKFKIKACDIDTFNVEKN